MSRGKMYGGRKKVKDAPRGVSGDGLGVVGLLTVMPGAGPELPKEGGIPPPILTLFWREIASPRGSHEAVGRG
jgi:hypothetical protein